MEKEKDDGAIRELAVSNLKSQYKNLEIRVDVLKWLGIVFIGMFLACSLVPQDTIPPEIIAVLGYVVAMVICSVKKIKVGQLIDLKSVLTIASFLFFAQWIAVAYAAAICAGSSLFMWSATAGFILSAKVNAAGIEEENGKHVVWGVGQYLKYGFINYAIQLSIALTVMVVVL